MPETSQDTEARIAQLAPLRAIIDDPAFAAQIQSIRAMRAVFLDDPLFQHISGLIITGENLMAALAKEPAAPEEPGGEAAAPPAD